MIFNDTIAAISTPRGTGGVAIIRISGENSREICSKIFKGKKSVNDFTPYLMEYGSILDLDGNLIDKVLCVYMKKGASYTGEDTVEIHCHGGYFVSEKILETVISAGARPALPGEFTKIAFLNGKMDLSQAEAVIDLINSKTNEELSEAVNRVDGVLSKKINDIRNIILDITAQVLVIADYPEEDIDYTKKNELLSLISEIKEKISFLIKTADKGTFLKEGISLALIGRPNTGKSSIMNVLSGENRAIVTDLPGTTRDVLECAVNINGFTVRIFDTAGIREAEGLVEKIGIDKSKEYLNKADVCVMVLDSSDITDEDFKILESAEGKRLIIAVNKTDLCMKEFKHSAPVVYVSAKEKEGFNELKSEIIRIVTGDDVFSDEKVLITNLRQKEALIRALENINGAISTLENDFPVDMVAGDLENAAYCLGEITGMTVTDEIIDRIFSKFCLGK